MLGRENGQDKLGLRSGKVPRAEQRGALSDRQPPAQVDVHWSGVLGLQQIYTTSLVRVARRVRMELYIKCDCGWQFRAEEPILVAAVREHGSTRHQLQLSDEQILAVARPVVPQDPRD